MSNRMPALLEKDMLLAHMTLVTFNTRDTMCLNMKGVRLMIRWRNYWRSVPMLRHLCL